MTYMERLNQFSDYCLQHKISSREILLFYALLGVCNRCRWEKVFYVQNAMLQMLTGLTASAICIARNSLCERGLISYDKQTGEYSVIDLEPERKQSVNTKKTTKERPVKEAETDCKSTGNNPETLYKVYKDKDKDKEEDKDILSPASPSTDLFTQFWEAYPRKTAKQAALKAFRALKPTPKLLGIILAALGKQKQSDGWKRDGGQYIPYPATYLHQRRWEDELPDDDPVPPEPPPPVVVTPDMDVGKRIFGPNDDPLEAIP